MRRHRPPRLLWPTTTASLAQAGLLTRRRFLRQVASTAPVVGLSSLIPGCTRSSPGEPERRGPEAFLAADRSTLEALCARLIPSDDDPGATETGVANYILTELATPYFAETAEQILAALRGLEQLAHDRGQSFSALSGEGQDTLLRALQSGNAEASGWRGQRTLQTLLALAYEGFLGDPLYGGNREGRGWQVIGFRRCGPQPSVNTIRRRAADHPSLRGGPPGRERADVVIVGSGAGGAPVAQLLSEAGMEVVLLEKGPWYTKRDFFHDEIGQCRRDFFIPHMAEDPHVIHERDKNPQVTNGGWTSRCVGGGTVHMSGFFLRHHPEDFRFRSAVGGEGIAGTTLADWPLTYEELAPHYSWVERALGVSGQYGPGQVGAPLPLPPLRAHPFSRFIDEGARRHGWHAFPTPRAVLSRSYSGRPSCTYCGFCGSYGCENDAKSSSLSVFLPRALATGKVQLLPGCQAGQVLLDGQGRAGGVRYFTATGEEREVRARLVVLACSAVETARLLLLSDSRRFPRGLANSSGLVGRNLLMSTFAGGEGWLPRSWATTAERREVLDSHLPFLQRTSQSHYWIPQAGLTHPKGGTIIFAVPHINPIHRAEHIAQGGRQLLWGQRLKDNLRTYYHRGRVMEFECFAEFLPTPGSQVTLDPEVRDHRNLPVARIALAPHEADREAGLYLVNRGLEILEAAGCTAPRGVNIGRATQILQGGTCRFGEDANEAVLDRDCQAFDVPNLFVTDGSFMPTSGAVPITLTIMANAARVARRIIEKSQRGELA